MPATCVGADAPLVDKALASPAGLRALVANRAVHVPEIAADNMVERLQRAWDFEPGTPIRNVVWRGVCAFPTRASGPPRGTSAASATLSPVAPRSSASRGQGLP